MMAMGTEKVSLTLDEALLAQAREVVGTRGLSSYVNRALSLQLQHDRLAGLLAELEQEKGPIEPQVMEEVRREWPAPGEKPGKRRSA
jgi:Arc/MetJ family transcription regulator